MPATDIDNRLAVTATRIRRLIVKCLHKAGSGHPGGSLSMTDLVTVLFFDEMRTEGENRDRFVLSKGHAAPGLYAAFAELGWIGRDELMSLRQLGSRLQGHPDRTRFDRLDAGSGALGQGVSIAIGYALASRMKGVPGRTYCILGDGESQEGQVWEAALYAPFAKLDNLCFILDNNNLQNETWVNETLDLGPLAQKWDSFGWHTIEIDGHDIDAIRTALAEARVTKGKPTIIVACTVKGKGVPFMENDNFWHGGVITDEHLAIALEALGP